MYDNIVIRFCLSQEKWFESEMREALKKRYMGCKAGGKVRYY
jgi:hypothetical protein